MRAEFDESGRSLDLFLTEESPPCKVTACAAEWNSVLPEGCVSRAEAPVSEELEFHQHPLMRHPAVGGAGRETEVK